jgi:hypothetical protein
MADKSKVINPGFMPLPKGLEPIQDKEWHFRWIHKDARFNTMELLVDGYEIVTKSKFSQVTGDPRVKANGQVVHGDAVLAVCKYSDWHSRTEALKHDTARKLRAIKRGFHNKTRQEGGGNVTSFEQDTPGPPGG